MSTKKRNLCKGKSKSGKHCRAAATAGGLCYFHANPNKAAELGRIGGRHRRASILQDLAPLPLTDTATSVRDCVAQLIAEVRSGKTNPKTAAGLVPLLNLQLRSIEVVNGEEIKRRLDALEARLQLEDAPANEDLDSAEIAEVVKQ